MEEKAEPILDLDTSPELAETLIRLAQGWAILHPAATTDERRALAALVGAELSGRGRMW